MGTMTSSVAEWPVLPVADWAATRDTLQLWTQIVGKVRMVSTPVMSHWWNVPLYVTSRGLTTSLIPRDGRGFQIDFDLLTDRLDITVTDGTSASFALQSGPVADFYRQLMASSTTRPAHRRLDDAGRDPRCDPLRRRHDAHDLRRRPGAPVLAAARPVRSACSRSSAADSSARSVRSTCSGVRWISPSPASPVAPPATPWRRAQLRAACDVGGVLARGQQRRLLAGARRRRRLLLLRLPGPRRLRRCRHRGPRRVLRRSSPSSCFRTRTSAPLPNPTGSCSSSCRRPTPQPLTSRVGTGPRSNEPDPSRHSARRFEPARSHALGRANMAR